MVTSGWQFLRKKKANTNAQRWKRQISREIKIRQWPVVIRNRLTAFLHRSSAMHPHLIWSLTKLQLLFLSFFFFIFFFFFFFVVVVFFWVAFCSSLKIPQCFVFLKQIGRCSIFVWNTCDAKCVFLTEKNFLLLQLFKGLSAHCNTLSKSFYPL